MQASEYKDYVKAAKTLPDTWKMLNEQLSLFLNVYRFISVEADEVSK